MEAIPQGDGVWEASPWLIVTRDGKIYAQNIPNEDDRSDAANQLASGETPREVFGRSTQSVQLSRVRSVEWVPAANTLLVRQHWSGEPWRLAVTDHDAGERLFRRLAALLPQATEPTTCQVGPNDLHMDPRLGLYILVAFVGLFALVGGAIEGRGPEPGAGQQFGWIIKLGAAIGPLGAMIVGGVAVGVAVFGLVSWYRHRPTKLVVRAVRKPDEPDT